MSPSAGLRALLFVLGVLVLFPLDFDEYERLLDATGREPVEALLVRLFGGEAGLRCGEMMALRWTDVDFRKRQLCVERSDWKGHVTATKEADSVTFR